MFQKNESFRFGKGCKAVGMHFMVRSGPGLMDVGTPDALEAQKPVGGFNIAQQVGEWTTTIFYPYISSHAYLTCR